jgi:tetratricopeptide (TPR) repeat protein
MLALTSRSLLAVGLAISIAGSPSVAHASPFSVPSLRTAGPGSEVEDSTEAEARSEFRAGSDAYALGNYEEAVTHFERAYELTHRPDFLFNLGQAYTRWYDISNDVEHLKKARRLYENYVLNVGATELDEEEQAQAQADAQRRITEVDRRIAQHQDATTADPITGTDEPKKKPVHKKAWFWVTIVGGLAVIGGVTAAVVLTTRKPGFEPELGTIGRAPVEGGGLTLRF